MNLLKYINTIKNIPDRFSNLAFWRCVRKLKDCIISAMDCINVWGIGVDTDLSALKEWKSSVDTDLSGLQEWKTGVDSSLSKVSNDITAVSNIAADAQTSATKALARINGAFEILEYDIAVSKPSNYQKIDNVIPSDVQYPHVDYYMLTFPVNDSRITKSDIIESATFKGLLNIDNRSVHLNMPTPLFPVIDGYGIRLVAYPFPIYCQSNKISIKQGQITLHIRCRRIPSE